LDEGFGLVRGSDVSKELAERDRFEGSRAARYGKGGRSIHLGDETKKKKKRNERKHIIGRQTYNGTHTHAHTYTVNRKIEKKTKNRKEKKFLLLNFFSSFLSLSDCISIISFKYIYTSQSSEKKEKKETMEKKNKGNFSISLIN
jgi:hypothetical protein